MTDLEMTKLCAEAMGLRLSHEDSDIESVGNVWALIAEDSSDDEGFHYRPLHDGGQAMALVKKFCIRLSPPDESDEWMASVLTAYSGDTDPNRAIVECVAKMQQSKQKVAA